MTSKIKIPIITGPTACGKTALSLELAKMYRIELISADAYQVYQHMDIGTAKPDASELSVVKHHLIDFLDPSVTYSAGDFFGHTQKLIAEILERGNLPIIIGGTGLYIDTLIKGIFNGPSRDDVLRGLLDKVIERKGVSWLYSYLKQIDPVYAEKISENDRQRIIRAIEVYKKIGMSFSEAHKQLMILPDYEYEVFILNRDRADLYSDINLRVVKMFEAGWLDEVSNLMKLGYSVDNPSFKAIGYREIAALIKDNGDNELLVSLIQKKTRNFAKRQLTWFRHMENVTTIQLDQSEKQILLTKFHNNYEAYRRK